MGLKTPLVGNPGDGRLAAPVGRTKRPNEFLAVEDSGHPRAKLLHGRANPRLLTIRRHLLAILRRLKVVVNFLEQIFVDRGGLGRGSLLTRLRPKASVQILEVL